MRIAVLARGAGSGHRTGIENYIYHLLIHLGKIDAENNYICYIPPSDNPAALPQSENFRYAILRPPFLWTQFGVSRALFKSRPELLFCPSHMLPLYRPLLKMVVTLHDLAFLRFGDMFSRSVRIYLGLATAYAVKKADRIIAVSNSTRNDLIDFFSAPPKKIKVIHHGCMERYKEPMEENLAKMILQRHNIKRPYLLSVGTLQPRKNFCRLIRAFEVVKERLKSEHLLVICGQRDWGSRPIIEMMKRSPYATDIIFTGYVPEVDLTALMQRADLFVLPSLYEGFGIPVIEAMAGGVPVVCSRASSLPEVAGEAALFFDPYSIDDMAEKIIMLLENRALRGGLVQKGRNRAESFSWTKTARSTLSLFEELDK